MKEHLIRYARAGYAGLFLCTPEETRAEAEVLAAAQDLERPLFSWSLTNGFVDTGSGTIRDCPDPVDALTHVETIEGSCIVLLHDLGMLLQDKDPFLIRKLRDTLHHAKGEGKLLVLLGIWRPLPAELEREITRIDLDLPGRDQLLDVIEGIRQSASLDKTKDLEAIVDAASGLTTMEAENALALSVVETGQITAPVVAREKAHTLQNAGLLEVINTTTSLNDIGGLANLKNWLLQRREAFGKRAREYGLPSSKGMLVTGVPGSGKSLTAKATASVFAVPLLRLDVGKLFGGIVGQSEANLRSVIQTAEAIAPCVLWIDELEKGFAGSSSSSGSTDGGTSARVFGSLLNWLQEKTKPVFIVATANDVSKLPPELLRKGRWDELWFVDLPNQQERTAIWDIVIEKYGRDKLDYDTVALARACELHTGAEVEAAFIEALHRAFSENREPTDLDLGEILCDFVPLATSMAEPIERLRHWAKGKARNATHADRPPNGKRKLDLG
tara:strand:- start:3676 stop:5175 length:1500 start_codon:yes stop_codon:yes gene_type:complete